MEHLSNLSNEFIPVDEALTRIYAGLPPEILANEEARLMRVFLEAGGKLVAIERLRGAENELTLFD